MSETVIKTEFDNGSKTLEHALYAAFDAGIVLGTGYPSPDAIPADWRTLRWRAFRDAWAGDPWDADRWSREKDQLEKSRLAQYREGGFYDE